MTITEAKEPAGPDTPAETLLALSASGGALGALTEGERRSLFALIDRTIDLAPGQRLIEEGESAEDLYVVETGTLEVLKRRADGAGAERVATIGAGDVAGELALVENAPRSASVRAAGPARVHAIPLAALEPEGPLPPGAELRLALARAVAQRLRRSTETSVRLLEDRLAEMTLRAEMGRFLTRVLLGISLYVFAMGFVAALRDVVPSSLVNLAVLAAFAAAVLHTIRTSPFKLARFGLTLAGWRRHARDALLWSLPVMGLIVLFKAALVAAAPDLAGERVFALGDGDGRGLATVLALVALYAVVLVPLQELVARAGIQSSCEMFLTGPHSALWAVILSNLLFSVTHMHVGLGMALSVLPAGLFWGWLFWRQRSLVGVCVSHATIGVFAFFVVGFPFVL